MCSCKRHQEEAVAAVALTQHTAPRVCSRSPGQSRWTPRHGQKGTGPDDSMRESHQGKTWWQHTLSSSAPNELVMSPDTVPTPSHRLAAEAQPGYSSGHFTSTYLQHIEKWMERRGRGVNTQAHAPEAKMLKEMPTEVVAGKVGGELAKRSPRSA